MTKPIRWVLYRRHKAEVFNQRDLKKMIKNSTNIVVAAGSFEDGWMYFESRKGNWAFLLKEK